MRTAAIPLLALSHVVLTQGNQLRARLSTDEDKSIKLTACPASGCSTTDTQCKSYVTPLNTCFNGQAMFPKDEIWGEVDVYDEIVAGSHILHRSFYETTNGTCGGDGATDEFRLPLGQCVGPFGDPLPWGTFELIKEESYSSS